MALKAWSRWSDYFPVGVLIEGKNAASLPTAQYRQTCVPDHPGHRQVTIQLNHEHPAQPESPLVGWL